MFPYGTVPTGRILKIGFSAVLLIRNDLVRIRILSSKPDEPNTVNSGNFVSFQTLIGFFLKSFWYGRPFFISVDVQNRGLGSGSFKRCSRQTGKAKLQGNNFVTPFLYLL